MSAQQRERLSRGQMSTTTGAPRAIGPCPDSWPIADCGPEETMTSSGSSQPCSSAMACMAQRTSSEVSPSRSSWTRSRATAMHASAAAWARSMPSSSGPRLSRRRRMKASGSTTQLDALRPEVVGDQRAGSRAGRSRRSTPSRRSRRARTRRPRSAGRRPGRRARRGPGRSGRPPRRPSRRPRRARAPRRRRCGGRRARAA